MYSPSGGWVNDLGKKSARGAASHSGFCRPAGPGTISPMKTPDPRRRAGRIVRELARLYPDARCALDYQNPLQLLVATILSA